MHVRACAGVCLMVAAFGPESATLPTPSHSLHCHVHSHVVVVVLRIHIFIYGSLLHLKGIPGIVTGNMNNSTSNNSNNNNSDKSIVEKIPLSSTPLSHLFPQHNPLMYIFIYIYGKIIELIQNRQYTQCRYRAVACRHPASQPAAVAVLFYATRTKALNILHTYLPLGPPASSSSLALNQPPTKIGPISITNTQDSGLVWSGRHCLLPLWPNHKIGNQ